MAIVWKGSDNFLYSKGVTRLFGENKIINLYLSSMDLKTEKDKIFACVQPLIVNPRKYKMIKFGYIK